MKSSAAAAFLATTMAVSASAIPLQNSQISYSSVISTAHTFATTHQYDAQFQSHSYQPTLRPSTKPPGCASWATLGAYTRAFGNSCCSQGLVDYCGAQQNNFNVFTTRPVIWTQEKFYQDCYNVWQNPNELSGARWVSVGGGGGAGQGFNGGFEKGDNGGGSQDYNGGSQYYNGGSKDYNGGSKDYNGISKDYSEGSKEYSGGSQDFGGSKDYNGGSKDYNGGSKDYEGGSQDYNEESKDYNGGSEECQSCGN